ncbi:nitrogen fixation protein NifZ [Skermanella rosea]|uniref:nitrogen fixation protein NifZ n=1 Tax=Skermanella rosea TaxID=1817965 RepID=UPI001933F543|nr:nitrogen fixation protein NifZ [Skermanella rosea]UEM01673.1 nitrogen fixation protein NifZ [Skermanella rosea]
MTDQKSPEDTGLTSDIVVAEPEGGTGYVPPREPKYEWGIAVKALSDLLNDGSHPDSPAGSLLVVKDTVGEIIRVGYAPEANNLPVYLVEFPGGKLVGCLEEEIAPVLGARSMVPGRMD